VIFVDAPQEIRLERAMVRDNAPAEGVLARIKNQTMGELYAREHSDFIIQNDNIMLITPQVLSALEMING
jgi:dephospho-CoA kinase